MWPLLKSSDNTISIQFFEPVLFIGSHIQTSPVLRGIISITSHKACLLKHLLITFQGVAKIKYVLNNKIVNDQRMINRDQLTLYSAQQSNDEINKHLVLNSNSSKLSFSFEMPLSTGLPETVECSQIQVGYQFTLDMDYIKHKKIQHQQIRKPVIVARLPASKILSGENLPEVIDSRKHLSAWCQYRMIIQKSAAAVGSTLPIHIEVAPLVNGLKLKHIFVQLLERRTVMPEVDCIERTCQFCYFLYPTKRTSFHLPSSAIDSPWEVAADYQIPQKSLTHSTEMYRNYSVHHLLLISLVIGIPEKGKRTRYINKTISFGSLIDILDKRIVNDIRLPSYRSAITLEEIENINRYGIHHLDLHSSPPDYHTII
ncbi:hypothetical protein G6F57_000319 [Rhizopus arrhizus]|uniref:Arrestin C-terminal-like domain-containing protein n=1 Tax=Rhizopus oryzae TaxID=64495 RepID=A0A9P7BNX2_RHIOR|nr:hypothetical protein G6F30_006895 [Rhizopus arrhizus]KAG0979867.1 hypothetical protein G6F29_008250 [Rhizopus arrhizus]KAG0992327.1 hypothetical protein G6F28_007741 [Rhizopus arrhizus]KAG1006370.1 hypothetical protein G6F27_008364 [Rhizopus arrhizus]KAG1022911.1 hypothetical protein G6F26_007247 [Rhizopus arrhizus]